MTKSQIIAASMLALAVSVPPSAAIADGVPRPACAVRGKAAGGVPQAICDALARHLAAAHPGVDPAGLHLVLDRATPRAVSGHVAWADGSARGASLSTDAQDGALAAADLDHFAQNALDLFLFR